MVRQIKNLAHYLLAVLANFLYGFPSKRLKIIAITGTDGKTTSSTLVYHVLHQAGLKVALISTVAAFIGQEEIDTGFHVTTPSPFALQKLLKRILDQGSEYVVLEVTSHGIDQNRVWGIHPFIGAITNVTHEHLDYHKTFSNYLRTKAKLLLRSQTAILNVDAKDSYNELKAVLETQGKSFETVSVDRIPKKLRDAVEKRFGAQHYNLQNSALAIAIAKKLEIKDRVIAQALVQFPGVAGRMQKIVNKRGVTIIVDFAHTPNALEEALRSLQSKTSSKGPKAHRGKLILVFGCAGLRDASKRPMMGEIATRLADHVILTAEDPRTEDVWSIIHQIKSGVQSGHQKIVSIADRYKAIEFALNTLAHPGDTILITGKGHEKSMCFGTTEYPWSDQQAVHSVLEK